MSKTKKGVLTAVIIVVVLAAAALLIWRFCSPAASVGAKAVTVEMTHPDGTVREETLHTDAETLWDAMSEAELIDGTDSEYGKWVTTVDGETADETAGNYWLFTKDGEWVDTACDGTYIADGEHYEFFIYSE